MLLLLLLSIYHIDIDGKTFYFIIVMIAGDMTGAYSVHTIYEGHEIMFHVSTMLPYSKDNKQQVNQL